MMSSTCDQNKGVCIFWIFPLQVIVIKNLAQEEGKDTKAFLKQQPFAKPGDKKYFLLK